MLTSYNPVVLNILYAAAGGVLTLVFMWIGVKLFSRFRSFNVDEELADGNTAVGMMVMGLLIGIGLAMGLVIGLGLN